MLCMEIVSIIGASHMVADGISWQHIDALLLVANSGMMRKIVELSAVGCQELAAAH